MKEIKYQRVVLAWYDMERLEIIERVMDSCFLPHSFTTFKYLVQKIKNEINMSIKEHGEFWRNFYHPYITIKMIKYEMGKDGKFIKGKTLHIWTLDRYLEERRKKHDHFENEECENGGD